MRTHASVMTIVMSAFVLTSDWEKMAEAAQKRSEKPPQQQNQEKEGEQGGDEV